MRELKGVIAKIATIVILCWCGVILYTAGWGAFHPTIHGLVAFALPALVLCFMLYPARKGTSPQSTVSAVDIFLILVSIITCAYVLFRYRFWMIHAAEYSNTDLLLSAILLCLIIEASRRSLGNIFVIIVGIMLVYTFLGHYIPGKWGHNQMGFDWVIGNLYATTSGYVGVVTWIVGTIVCIFILAGPVLFQSGAGETFIDVAKLVGGRVRGGGAQLSVVSSAFFGTISGSPLANVATTGAFTIPLMKRLGYGSVFAGAVETAASTGGQIMPPIMGAGAFIMAEMLGISYLNVCVAAALPAVLYFGGVGAGIYLKASKLNFAKVPREEIPSVRDVIKWRKLGPLIAFIVVLFYLLVQGRTPQFSCFWGLMVLIGLFLFTTGNIGLAAFKKRFGLTIEGFIQGGRNLVSLASIILCVQVVIYLIGLTGLGIKFSEVIYALGEDSIILSLFLTGVVAMILGMGVPTTAAYVIGVSVLGMGLIKLGFFPLGVHLFIFYWAILSVITPPVCLAAYVAAGISGAKWLPTGIEAWRLGIAAFIVPFMFAFNPRLLLQGDFLPVVIAVFTSFIGVGCLAAGAMGYLLSNLNIVQRIILILGAVLLIQPKYLTDTVGIGAAVLVLIWQILRPYKKSRISELE